MNVLDRALEKNLLPDRLIRLGIRRLLARRLRAEDKGSPEANQTHQQALLARLSEGPIAVLPEAANEQHYEVPTAFYKKVLGRHLKYSSGLWSPHTAELDQAEEDMLALTCRRAQLEDGQDILELGCGWGSLTLYMAEQFPTARITAVSNSKTQRSHIEAEAAQRGLTGIRVITCDINDLDLADQRFDRVVSVEMFEHVRNHRLLFQRIAEWLRPGGLLFVHIFVHRAFAYLFEDESGDDWMARYFFSGGMMPSDHWLWYVSTPLQIQEHWRVNGYHYGRTAEAWLTNMDRHKDELMRLFRQTYGGQATKWWVYWRVFFMACAELWGFRKGSEWYVSHYRFLRP